MSKITVIYITTLMCLCFSCGWFQKSSVQNKLDIASDCAIDCTRYQLKNCPVEKRADDKAFTSALLAYLSCVSICTGTGVIADIAQGKNALDENGDELELLDLIEATEIK